MMTGDFTHGALVCRRLGAPGSVHIIPFFLFTIRVENHLINDTRFLLHVVSYDFFNVTVSLSVICVSQG